MVNSVLLPQIPPEHPIGSSAVASCDRVSTTSKSMANGSRGRPLPPTACWAYCVLPLAKPIASYITFNPFWAKRDVAICSIPKFILTQKHPKASFFFCFNFHFASQILGMRICASYLHCWWFVAKKTRELMPFFPLLYPWRLRTVVAAGTGRTPFRAQSPRVAQRKGSPAGPGIGNCSKDLEMQWGLLYFIIITHY